MTGREILNVNSSDIAPLTTLKAKVKANAQRALPLAGIIIITAFYVVIFIVRGGNEGLFFSPLIAIPVILAGWFYGGYWGVITSIVAIILNAVLFTISLDEGWKLWVESAWPGNVMVLLVGYIAGRLKRVYERRFYVEAQLRSRERYLALVNMAINSILSSDTLEDKYHFLLSHLANLFIADHAHLLRWDETQGRAAYVATTKPIDQSFSSLMLNSDESKIIASVLRDGDPLVIEDLSKPDYAINPAFLGNSLKPTGTLLCLPLIAGEFKFGAVIIAYDLPRRINPDEIQYARLAGNQLGLALWNAQQEFKIEKQLKEAEALANIERVLSETEQVGIETVLQLIVDSAHQLILGTEQAVLHMLDDKQQILIPRAVSGIEDRSGARLNMHVGEGIAGQVILTGQVICVSDARNDPRFLNQATPLKFRSLIVAPIKSNEHCVGTISVQSTQPNVFTAEESRLLGSLGTHATVAIENASLLETTQQDLKEINALYQISQGLAASLDPDQLMKDVVELLQQYFGYYHTQIFISDPQTGDFVARCGQGAIGNQLKERGLRVPVGAGIVGHVAETGLPFITNDVTNVSFYKLEPLLPNTQSELAVPIKIGDQVLGMFDVQQTHPRRLTSRDLHLMIAVSDQLAAALQKANLYTDLQTSLHQEKETRSQLIQSERLATVGRLLASVSHELGNPLQALQNALFLLKEEKGISDLGRQDLQIVLEETERMTAMIERLRSAYRPTRVEDFQNIQVNEIVENVRALTATLMRHQNVSLEFYPDPQLPVIPGIPDQIRQVILNLFMNAVEAMRKDGGRLIVRTLQLIGQDKILLLVTDTGPGIDSVILPHIFEPFTTDKETGTGLGLTITYDIIRQHGGTIEAENNPEGGAIFKVWLPLAAGVSQ